MTTALEVGVSKRIQIRAVFGYLDERDTEGTPYPLSIRGAADHLSGIENLLYLASVTNWDAEFSKQGPWTSRPEDFVRQVYVRRISYASPLEVVVWFIAGTTAATTSANRIIRVWKNFQEARLMTSKADLWTAAANVLQATIDAPIPLDGPATTGYDRFNLAARTLALLSELEVKEEA